MNNKEITAAQTADRKVEITATITPVLKDVPVYFEVIDPDDLSPYEGKTLSGNTTTGTENHKSNDNRDPAKRISVAADYTAFQKCLSKRNEKTDETGKAKIELTVSDRYSGDNYIVRAACMNPAEKPFDKYTLTPPDTPGTPATPSETVIANITQSLQYEEKTTIAQSALLVAWKRTYIEHAEMYKKGATITASATTGTNTLTVDNANDFSGESTPGAGDGTEVTVFLPKDGSVKFDRRVVSTTTTPATITLDAAHPYDIPQYSGVKLKADNTVYTNDTSYLVKAYGGDAGGVDGGAFIEFKDIATKTKVPKYTEFPNDRSFRIAFQYALEWTSCKKDNTYLLIAARHSLYPANGVTYPIARTVFIFHQIALLQAKDVINHETGHVWNLLNSRFPHVDAEKGRYTHDTSDKCIMSYDRNRNDVFSEFCIECLEYLRTN